ncbi:HNH endonuclease [Veillonella ratti]|uniref:HNH endonuclease n=1 Tax=Veillonella ratti TaxID=103892 RepID=UPI000F8F4D54|nr:HNH endonuclease [Veillonella ratti]
MARDFSKDFYNATRWRKNARAFAESKLWICERCQNRHIKKAVADHSGDVDGVITKGKQRFIVHHVEPLTPDNINDDYIAYGWDNLQLLCIECHNTVHAKHCIGRQLVFDGDGNLVKIVEDTPHGVD